jgi:peptidoglycan/LPS O-acetylase OafA/YrhL
MALPTILSSSQAESPAIASSISKPKSHLFILDLLRGVAALGVCLFHYTTGALPTFKNPITQFLGHRGYLGVDIFFVISGFIIPYALSKSNYTLKGFTQFILRRFIRIAPPAYLTMAVYISLLSLLAYFHLAGPPTPLTGPLLLHNLLFTIPFTNYQWINGIFWTLGIEFQFYIILGLTFPFIRDNKFGLLIIGLLLSFTNYIPGVPEPTLFHHSTLFTIGLATWLFFDKRISPVYFSVLLLLFGAIGISQVTAPPIIIGIATALCILYIRFNNPISEFLGKISYSLYLLHIIIGFTVETLLTKVIPTINLATVLFVLTICVASSIAFSYLFYQYIEKPFMSMSSQLFKTKRNV